MFAQVFSASIAGLLTGLSTSTQSHPEHNPVGGYALSLSEAGRPFEAISIQADGTGCERLEVSTELYTACLVATNLLPSVIGGSAQGKLNVEETPAFHALVWRARANTNADVCDQGGLLLTFLESCRTSAVATDYRHAADGFVVTVPLGGAIPDASSAPATP